MSNDASECLSGFDTVNNGAGDMLLSEQVVQWTRDWFTRNGRKTAVIGISGGKDSAVVAAICAKALGSENVVGVMLPNGVQPDIEDARRVIERLGIRSAESNIGDVFNASTTAIVIAALQALPSRDAVTISENAKINVAPRVRMLLLYGVAQTLSDLDGAKAAVVGTGNRGEAEVGYTTKWGDSACDVNPIRYLWVRDVIRVGEELGLPPDILHKTPADGLSGQSDEQKLGFTYDEVEAVITGEGYVNADTAEAIRRRNRAAQHKLKPIPCFPKVRRDGQ